MCASWGFVEGPVNKAHGVKPVPADRGILEAGPEEELRRVDRAGCLTIAQARTVCRSPIAATSSTPVASPPSTTTRSTVVSARSSRIPRASASAMYIVHRRLAGGRQAALDARPAARAVRVGVGIDRLELGTERAEAGLDRVDALLPVRSLADTEHAFDVVVVRRKVRDGERGAPVARQPLAGCHFATSRSCARKAASC